MNDWKHEKNGLCYSCRQIRHLNLNNFCTSCFIELNVRQQEEEKNQNWLVKLWNKTIFPDKIKRYKEQKAWKRQLQEQARIEAQKEIEAELKKQYKEDIIAKATGKKTGKTAMEKLAAGFKMEGFDTTNKVDMMLGSNKQVNQQVDKNQQREETYEEKIKRLMR